MVTCNEQTCRFGERCSRLHNRPPISQTLVLVHMYQPLNRALLPYAVDDDQALETNDKESEQHFEEFFEDVFYELRNYGKLEELNVCDNIGPHLLGNVYVKFRYEEDAEKALRALTGRFYAGKPIVAEFSPVTDFREACCRQYDFNECTRGGECNFMHLKAVSPNLYKKLFGKYPRSRHARGGGGGHDGYDRRHRSPSRSRSRSRDRHRSRSRSKDRHRRSRSRSRDRHRSRSRSRDRHRSRSRSHSRDRHRRSSRHHRERERDRDDGSRSRSRSGSRSRKRERERDRESDRERHSDARESETAKRPKLDDGSSQGSAESQGGLVPPEYAQAPPPYGQGQSYGEYAPPPQTSEGGAP